MRSLPLALVSLAAFALHAGFASAQDAPTVDPDAGYVQVSGSAEVTVPVDRAHVRFAVETEEPDARAAVERNAQLMDAVLSALRALEVDGLDLETQGFELQPQYERPSGETMRIRAYRARNHVAVTLDDLEMVGRVIDAAVGAGANRIASLSFEARDTEEARREALRMAVAEARQQAEVMASALGRPLGPPLEVNGGAQQSPPPPRPMARTMEMAQAAPSTPVETGDQTVSASVTIKFRLGPDGG